MTLGWWQKQPWFLLQLQLYQNPSTKRVCGWFTLATLSLMVVSTLFASIKHRFNAFDLANKEETLGFADIINFASLHLHGQVKARHLGGDTYTKSLTPT